ncbi:MAG: zinc-binding dehydrogenase [Acidimicrobiales bacterium]
MRALLVERLVHRFAAARMAAAVAGSGAGIAIGPLRLGEFDPPSLPGPRWHRVTPLLSGICGSDLAMLDGASSHFFEDVVTFPFVPGHEVVGVVTDGPDAGRRIVVEPVLSCVVRGIDPPCPSCAVGRTGACERIAFGHLRPGLQTGYCADTGGGWSDELVAHEAQLHLVPDEMRDEAAVMVEPAACAVHAALGGGVMPGERVVVLGSGTVGLCTLAALRRHTLPSALLSVAKYRVQRRFAEDFGADEVVAPSELGRAVRRMTGTLALASTAGAIERLAGGADVVFDCVGSARSIAEALEVVRPGGRIVLVGMPGIVRVDLAPLWQREIALVGAYAYGTEEVPEGSRRTFALAFELVVEAQLERLVSAHYPLERYEEAVRHAASAGRRGSVKVVFDLRREDPGWRRPAVSAASKRRVPRGDKGLETSA